MMKNRRAAEGRQFDRASRGHVRRGADRPEPGGREQPKLDIRSLAGVLKIAPEVLRETFLADPALGRLVAATSPLLLRAAVAEQPADASPTAPLECLERVTTPAPQGGAGQRDTATPTGPEHRPEQVTTPAPQGGAGQRDTATPTGPKHRPELVIPRERPGFAEQTDAEYVQTPGQYTIEIANCDIRIYDPQGRRQTRIWGDPHVDEGAAGDDWHFGQDSTFILPDGTKICLDTEPNAADEWYVVGADILAGTSRYHFGVGDDAGMTQDALEFDKGRADRALDESAGVFAMAEDGQWAVQAPDGHFYDITSETWAAYQGDRDIDFDPTKRISLTDDQKYASRVDHMPGYVQPPSGGEWDNGQGGAGPASMRLTEPQTRPGYLNFPGSDIVQTPDGYTVEMQAPEVIIHDRQGNTVTRIWGDPHVDEGGDGTSEWHFGQDSTFILPDGTKISLNTEPNAVDEWYVVGVDVTMGPSRFHHGVEGEAGMTGDGLEWDMAHADRALDESAGVFALQDNGQWAVQAPDGQFYDITEENWAAYQGDRDIDFDPSSRANITLQQRFASQNDQLPSDMRIPELGAIPDLDWVGKQETVPPLGGMSEREAIGVLRRYMPPWHINLFVSLAPRLLPMIAEDRYLAEHLAELPLAKLKQMLLFLPPSLRTRPRRAETSEARPERVRGRFDRAYFGWEDRARREDDAPGREAWWLRSGSFAG